MKLISTEERIYQTDCWAVTRLIQANQGIINIGLEELQNLFCLLFVMFSYYVSKFSVSFPNLLRNYDVIYWLRAVNP